MPQRPLFISSTFLDMQDERDSLARLVMPVLRAQFETPNNTINEIDLRWGVTRTMAMDGGAVRICLDGVKRAVPRLVGIVGDRIGWTPEPGDFRVADPEFERWLPGDFGLTGAELAYAAHCAETRGQRMPVFLRAPALSQSLGFAPDNATRLAELRDWIACCPQLKPISYTSIDEFTERALSEITDLFRETRDLSDADSRLGTPIDRRETISALNRVCKWHGRAILTGPDGSGLSWIARSWAEAGLSNQVYDGRRRDSENIFASLDWPARHDTGPRAVIRSWLAWLERLRPHPNTSRVVLDHFENAFRTYAHASLASLAPPRGHALVVVTRHTRLIDEARSAGWPIVEATPPTPTESLDFSRTYLASFGKTLEPNQGSVLRQAPWLSNIHLLRLVLDELRRHGRMEDLTERLVALSRVERPQDVIDEIAGGISSVLPNPWRCGLRPFLVALTLSLRGLSEADCRRLFAASAPTPDPPPLPAHLWSAVRSAFGAALNEWDGRIDVGSRSMRDYVDQIAAAETAVRAQAERAFATWLEQAPAWQRAEEAPRLALALGGSDSLARLLGDPGAVQEILVVGETFLEGWMEELPARLRGQVAEAWTAAAENLPDETALALGLLAHRTDQEEAGLSLVAHAADAFGPGSVAAATEAWLHRDTPQLRSLVAHLDWEVAQPTPDMLAKGLVALSGLAQGLVMLEIEDETRILSRAMQWAIHARPDIQAQIAYLSGQIAVSHADWPAADRYFAHAETIARQTGNAHALAEALERRSAVNLATNRFSVARRTAEEACLLALRLGFKNIEALALERCIEIAQRTARDEDFFRWTKTYFDRSAAGVGSRDRATAAYQSWDRKSRRP